jgi:hypothetical protein
MRLAGCLLVAIWLGASQAEPSRDKHEATNDAGTPDRSKSQKADNGLQPALHEQSVNREPSRQERSGETAGGTDQPHDWIDKLNAFSTSVIALFTVFLFFAVIWQTRTARDTERAWIIAAPTEAAPVVGFALEGGLIWRCI